MTARPLRLGLDLDNTIVSYDALFAQLADEQGLLPPLLERRKKSIRDYLRNEGLEDRWTELQGIAYGSRMRDAVAFDGVREFLDHCRQSRVEWCIVSHRSRFPYRGKSADLHDSARQWLADQRIIAVGDTNRVYLELSLEAKLQRIAELRCDAFVDDLVEVLLHAGFPPGVKRILFDPGQQQPPASDFDRAASWSAIAELLGI